jgi:hypothetical protein
VGCTGDFQLTGAIRPAPERSVVPRQGYRLDLFRDERYKIEVPVLAAAVSCPQLFDVFLALLEPLGEVVDVILETSHEATGAAHRDLYREEIDRPVLASHLCDFEELLLHDGCTGIAVLAITCPMEVQFDEHKGLIVYAPDVKPFVRILRREGIRRDQGMRLLSEGEHLHRTSPRYADAFEQLCYRLGVGEAAEHINW